MSTDADPRVSVSTPCMGVCRLDRAGFCTGCRRTGAEIAAWRGLDEIQRRHIMDVVLPARRSP